MAIEALTNAVAAINTALGNLSSKIEANAASGAGGVVIRDSNSYSLPLTINGKPVKAYTVNIPALPNNAKLTVPIPSSITTSAGGQPGHLWVDVNSCRVFNNVTKETFPLPATSNQIWSSQLCVFVEGGAIAVETQSDMSALSGSVTINYIEVA